MKVRNIDNGQIINVGDKFLQRQAKPVIASGKKYDDGVWVQHVEKKMSKEAADIVKNAAAPTAKAEAGGTGTTPKAEELAGKKEG